MFGALTTLLQMLLENLSPKLPAALGKKIRKFHDCLFYRTCDIRHITVFHTVTSKINCSTWAYSLNPYQRRIKFTVLFFCYTVRVMIRTMQITKVAFVLRSVQKLRNH
jgi:hypothetical protein